MHFHLYYTDGFTDLAVISANKITAASFSSLYPSCQIELCLAWGSRGDTSIESDKRLRCAFTCCDCSIATCSSFPLSVSYLSQAVIQNPFSNGGSPAGEAVGGETRFAYFPATAVSDGTVSVQATTDPTLTQAGGELVFILDLGRNLPQCYMANSAIIICDKQECIGEYCTERTTALFSVVVNKL